MKSEKEIVAKLAKKLESERFRRVDLAISRLAAMPDLLIEFDKFIQLIEVKAGPSDEYIPHGFYSTIDKMISEASEYFGERGYIVRAFLITNQKISWKDLFFHITLIKTLNVSKIAKILKDDIKDIKATFDKCWKELLHRKETEIKLINLQRIVQLSPLLDEAKVKEIIEKMANDSSPSIRGELCYLLGRWGKPDVIPTLINFLKDSDKYVRSQAGEALSKLRKIMDKQVEEKMQLEEDAYLALEEELLKKYPGQFAAFYKSRLISVNPDKIALIKAVEKEIGPVRYYIRRISKELSKLELPKAKKAIEDMDLTNLGST